MMAEQNIRFSITLDDDKTHRLILEGENQRISILKLSEDELLDFRNNPQNPVTAELQFNIDEAVATAANVLAEDFESVKKVEGAYRMMAATVLLLATVSNR